ncbi:MAG: response regulator [Bacteroidetes bacterium]|nr:response regulator [Bacteroidota bacterium]
MRKFYSKIFSLATSMRSVAILATLAAILSAAPLLAQSTSKLDSLRKIADTATDLDVKLNATYLMGNGYRNTKPDSTRLIGEWLLKMADEHQREDVRASGYFLLGMAYNTLGDNRQSIESHEKAIQIRGKLGDKKNLADSYHSITYPLYFSNQFAEALQYEVKALELFTELLDSAKIAACYNELGKYAAKMKKHELGVAYAKKGLEINLQAKKSPYTSYSRLGLIYTLAENTDSAGFFFEKALEVATKENIPRAIATEQNNLAETFLKKGDYARAKKLLQESLTFFEGMKAKQTAIMVLGSIADLAIKTGDANTALTHTRKALGMAENVNDPATLATIYDIQAKAYAALGQHQNAFLAARKYEVLHDSVVTAERSQEAAAVEAQFRTTENQKTIAYQNLQLERQQGRNRLFMSLALFAIVTGVGIALFLREKRRRAELALRLETAETDRLRELDTVKSAFFANISHEFRTPLTLLLGPLREMEAGTFRGDAKKYFGIMRRNAARLLSLVNQLLDLSRLESGKLQLQTQAADLHRTLRTVAGSFESLADQKQIEFRVQIPQEPFWAKFDADKLEKIIGNLLSNAFKFTQEEGQVDLRFTTDDLRLPDGSAPIVNHQSSIVISDTGMGIPAEQLPHIFERFYQVENTGADIQPGSGIGLALTKELVELHGGQINVESKENEGTRFTVTFNFEKAVPVEVAAEIQIPIAIGTKSEIASGPQSEIVNRKSEIVNQKPQTSRLPIVLVAEDNPDVRSYILEQLQGKYQLIAAKDGQDALEIAQSRIPDLVLTDLMMPGLDGNELTRRLKSDVRTNHIPVVMLTAKSAQGDRIGGIETGAEAYLTKPFDAAELRATLNNLLAQRRILQEKFSRQIRLDAPAEAVVSLDDQFLQKVLAAIEENLDDETFGVENLASAVDMSRSNLFRKVEALLGKSPNQLIRERRLLRAKSLLEQGAGNSTEVAFMTGFNSPSYFAKCYVEMFGEAPGVVARRKGEVVS